MCSLDGRSETSTGAIPGERTRASLGEVCEDRLDGFLCSRNARSRTSLVGRAHDGKATASPSQSESGKGGRNSMVGAVGWTKSALKKYNADTILIVQDTQLRLEETPVALVVAERSLRNATIIFALNFHFSFSKRVSTNTLRKRVSASLNNARRKGGQEKGSGIFFDCCPENRF